MLRARDGRAARRRRRHARASRRGFYALARPRLRVRCSRSSMRHRWVVVALSRRRHRRRPCRSTAGSSRSTCRPTSTRPSSRSRQRARGHRASPRWTRSMRADRAEVARDARRAHRARSRRAAASSAASTRATCTCASRRTRSARSRSAGSGARRSTASRWRAFHGNYSQRDVMQRGAPAARASSATSASSCATPRRSTSAAAASTSTSSIRGPDLEALAKYAEELRDARRSRSAASSTPTRRCGSTSPSCASSIDRERAADLGVDAQDIATALRLDGRRRRRVSRFRDPRDRRGLRRAAPAARGATATTAARSRGCYVPRQDAPPAAQLVRLDNVVQIEPGVHRVAHRPLDRQREVRLRAVVAARLRPGRPDRGAARRGRAR